MNLMAIFMYKVFLNLTKSNVFFIIYTCKYNSNHKLDYINMGVGLAFSNTYLIIYML